MSTENQQGGSNPASWPGGTPRNDTPDTPELSESELRAMHVDQVREIARREGVPRADELPKEELVDAISQLHRQRTAR